MSYIKQCALQEHYPRMSREMEKNILYKAKRYKISSITAPGLKSDDDVVSGMSR
jgi:hypothetical protein